jgi:hypothetical protein
MPAVRHLEGRQLLSAAPTATMTQTATFPNLESFPNVATQAFLYFSAPMGTLTEVDVVTSGSYSTDFSAENLAPSTSAIQGTTKANLSINLPSGAIPVTIPSVTENFNASAFDGTLNYAGTSGKDFGPVTSSAPTQTTVLTSPADLAAFTGNFRIPITVSGHATGSATSSNGNLLSDGFKTQTSVTLTIIYHYDPNLPSLNPPPANSSGSQTSSGPSSGDSTGTSTSNPANVAPASSTGTASTQTSAAQTTSTQSVNSSAHTSKKAHALARNTAHHPKGASARPKSVSRGQHRSHHG